MAITDLTGYRWTGNATISISSAATYDIQGVLLSSDNSENDTTDFQLKRYTGTNDYSGETEYVIGLQITGSPNYDENGIIGGWCYYANSSSSYPSSCSKANTSYKHFSSIKFTGGTDATNTELIAWLEVNGTLEKMVEPVLQIKPFLKGIADAIRNKKGTTESINAQNFASEIESIETGSGLTGYSGEIRQGDIEINQLCIIHSDGTTEELISSDITFPLTLSNVVFCIVATDMNGELNSTTGGIDILAIYGYREVHILKFTQDNFWFKINEF